MQAFQKSSVAQYIVLISSDFSNNFGYVGVGLYIEQRSFQTFAAALEYDMIDITITNSKIKVPSDISADSGTAIYMNGLHRVNILNIVVAGNTPVQGADLSSTNWIMTGMHNVFRNNSAQSGGAMSLSLGSWLQFVFPFYIWLLILLVVVISKFSSTFSRLIGHNILPVFSTLILLSYTKLFRVIVPVLQFEKINCNITGQAKYFWSLDANVSYTSLDHLALLFFSLLVFIVVIVPFTVVMFIHAPLLTKISLPKCHKLLLRLKPVFDAYYGPYKEKCSIWTGVLLVARLFLVIAASVSPVEVYRSVAMATATILLTAIVLWQGIYKSRVNDAFECLSLLNLTILVAFVQYSQYVTVIGVVITILMFLGICLYQFYAVCIKQCYRTSIKTNENLLASVIEDSENVNVPSLISRTIIDVAPVAKQQVKRETLLLDSDDKENNPSIPYKPIV